MRFNFEKAPQHESVTASRGASKRADEIVNHPFHNSDKALEKNVAQNVLENNNIHSI